MYAPLLEPGGTIGIIALSHIADPQRYELILYGIQARGFHVKLGQNLYKNTYGYLASEAERAEDLNAMVRDPEVRMIFFGGGDGGPEVLPLIDYQAVGTHPKLYLSYSDGTSVLNAIHSRTGLVTYYGQSPGEFEDLRQYTYAHFCAHFLQGAPDSFTRNSPWHTIKPGVCEGILTGGFTMNFAMMLNSEYYRFDRAEKYILFLEDHEKFSGLAHVSAMLSHVEQSPLIHNISGLLFGHFSKTIYPDLMARLERFGEKYGVPVAYCDDFGHGVNHGILPIGGRAVLDTARHELRYLYQ